METSGKTTLTELVDSKTKVKWSIVNFQELTQSAEWNNSVGHESRWISERLVYHRIATPDSWRKRSSAKLRKKICVWACVGYACACDVCTHTCQTTQISNPYVHGMFLWWQRQLCHKYIKKIEKPAEETFRSFMSGMSLAKKRFGPRPDWVPEGNDCLIYPCSP